MPDITDLKQPHGLLAALLRTARRGSARVYNVAIREGDGAIREGER